MIAGTDQVARILTCVALRYLQPHYTEDAAQGGEKMNTACMKKLSIWAALLTLLGWLAGCSPQYDWRMVSIGDGRVRAMLPAKPQEAERELEFEGHALTFVLTSASVDGVLFTVGYAELPDALRTDPSARKRLAEQTVASLYRNLGAATPAELPSLGDRFAITGTSQDDETALALEASIWTTPDTLVEGIVIGAVDALPQPEITEFFRELAPDLRPR